MKLINVLLMVIKFIKQMKKSMAFRWKIYSIIDWFFPISFFLIGLFLYYFSKYIDDSYRYFEHLCIGSICLISSIMGYCSLRFEGNKQIKKTNYKDDYRKK